MVVSHSAAIAAGVADLVTQSAGVGVAVLPVGGACDGALGTDGAAILAALRTAARGGGGVVLVDIGSSVLAVRAALERLSSQEESRIRIVNAPLVEGAFAAGVIASTGAGLELVAQAAEKATFVVKT